MRARVVLFARVKDAARATGYRFENVQIRKGRPVQIPTATSFYLRYQANGKRVVKAVGSDLEVAFVSFENHERNIHALMRGESIAQDLLNDFQENAAGESLAEAAENYFSQLQGKAKATVSNYRFAVNEFIEIAGGRTRIQSVDRNTLLRYRSWLYDQKLGERTIHNRLLRVSIFLKSVGRERLLRRTDWPKPNKRVPEAYSQDEINKLLTACSPEEGLLFTFFLVSGARAGEVRHAVLADIRISRLNGFNGSGEVAVLTIRAKPELGWQTKSKRDRTVRLPLVFAKRLLEARAGCEDGDLLFPNKNGGANNHFDASLRRVSKKAGLGGRIDCHKFRSTYATRLSAAGMPVQDIQKCLGHASVETTMRYLAATSYETEIVGKQIEAAFGV